MTDNTDMDPLEALLLDSAAVDRARLATALKDLVGIDRSNGRVVPKPAFRSLTNRHRVLVILLGLKAAALREVRESEATKAGDLPSMCGMPEGTLHPLLKELRDEHRVSQTGDGLYYLSDHDVPNAIAELDDGPAKSRKDVGRGSTTAARSGKKKAQTSKNTSPGPKAMLTDLIESGWFDEPRTLADVLQHVAQTKARRLKVTSISSYFSSWTRSGVLERDKNEQGKYQYKKTHSQ